MQKMNQILKFVIAIMTGFAFTASAAYAEYYFVVPGEVPVSCIYCETPKKHYKKHKKKHVTHKRTHYKKRSTYSISIYYVWQAGPCSSCYYDGCGYWTRAYEKRQVYNYDYYYAPSTYPSSYYYQDRYYDPDLTTGDDDPTVYPGMNIDR